MAVMLPRGGSRVGKDDNIKKRRSPPNAGTGAFTLRKPLQSALDLAATQAARADVHMTNGAANGHADTLGVRQPNAIALAVGVADVVAAHGALLANLTNLSHNHTSFWCVNSHNTIILASEWDFDKGFFHFVGHKIKKTDIWRAAERKNEKRRTGFFPESL